MARGGVHMCGVCVMCVRVRVRVCACVCVRAYARTWMRKRSRRAKRVSKQITFSYYIQTFKSLSHYFASPSFFFSFPKN